MDHGWKTILQCEIFNWTRGFLHPATIFSPWLFLAKKKMLDHLRTIEITHHWYHWILDIVSKGWHILLPFYTPPMPIHTSDLFAERADVGLSSHRTWSWNMNKKLHEVPGNEANITTLGMYPVPSNSQGLQMIAASYFFLVRASY